MTDDDDALACRYPFLAGASEAARLMRATDWGATPIGPPEQWPAALRGLVGTLLGSRHPMFLWWGPDLVQFYNDAYIPSVGAHRHPTAMGQRGRDCWPEIWPVIGPQIEAVMQRGESTWHEDQLVPIMRHGRMQDVYWTYSYSPARLEDGAIGGVLVVCSETTGRMVAARQQAALAQVVAALARLPQRTADPFDDAMTVLHRVAQDAPGAALLRWTDDAAQPPEVLACIVGNDHAGAHGGSAAAALAASLGGQHGPFETLHRGELVHLAGVTALSAPGHAEPITDVMLLPLRPIGPQPAGLTFLAVGLNPRLPVDAAYRSFLQQLADALSASIDRNASAIEHDLANAEYENLIRQAPVGIAKLMGPARPHLHGRQPAVLPAGRPQRGGAGGQGLHGGVPRADRHRAARHPGPRVPDRRALRQRRDADPAQSGPRRAGGRVLRIQPGADVRPAGQGHRADGRRHERDRARAGARRHRARARRAPAVAGARAGSRPRQG